jgi:hypothetical protein
VPPAQPQGFVQVTGGLTTSGRRCYARTHTDVGATMIRCVCGYPAESVEALAQHVLASTPIELLPGREDEAQGRPGGLLRNLGEVA